MGQKLSAENNEVKCYKCGESLPALRDQKNLTEEFHYGKKTDVFFDGKYYRFVDHNNGYQCPPCFWKPLVDKDQEKDEKNRAIVEAEGREVLFADLEKSQDASKNAVKQLKLDEISKHVDKWIEREQFTTTDITTKNEEIKDSCFPEIARIFNSIEPYSNEEDISEMAFDREEVLQLFSDNDLQISKLNILQFLRLTTDRDKQAQSVLKKLTTEKRVELLRIFKEILFPDYIKGSSLEFVPRLNVKMLKWIQLFLLDLLIKSWMEDDSVITNTQTSCVHLETNLFSILYSLQEVIDDTVECVQLTRSLYLLKIHHKFYSDQELVDINRDWLADKYEDCSVITVKFLNRLIQAIGSINYNSRDKPCFWNWTIRACELLISTYVSVTSYNYQTLLTKLVKSGSWYPLDLVEILPLLLQKLDMKDCYLPRVLEYITTYRLPRECLLKLDKHESFAEILRSRKESSELLQIIRHKITMETDKTLNALLDEISEADKPSCFELSVVKHIVHAALSKLGDLGHPQELRAYRLPSFQYWADTIRSHRSLSYGILIDSLVTLCCAVKHAEGYWPRVTQMISWCLLVMARPSQGRLLQIRTGEGKSCVIAMVATMFACLKKSTDIVTSSPLLAVRDSEEWSNFYKLFGLSTSNNVNNNTDEERLQCYRSPIVYGTVSLFASDILRQEFQLKNVRGSRGMDSVIVDEVDVMLLDQGVQFTYLSESYAGLRHLQPVLAMVWNAVAQHRPLCTQSGEVLYTGLVRPFYHAVCDVIVSCNPNIDYMQLIEIGELEGIFENSFKDEVKAAEQSMERLANVLSKVSKEKVITFLLSLREYVPLSFLPYTLNTDGVVVPTLDRGGTEHDVSAVPILVAEHGTCMVLHGDEVFLKHMIVDNLTSHIATHELSDEVINIPDNIADFVKNRLPIWVENAFKAVTMTEGREYIVKEENIVPIDYMCTGVVETNKKWSDGLQQFLEMKHRLAVSDLSLVTNFMSNISFFLRYRKCIFGVTGTVGSEVDQEFIRKQFGVDLCSVPTSLNRKLYEDDGLVCDSDSEWINQVCDSVKSEINSIHGKLGRAALVICEDIKKADVLYEALKCRVTDKILLYTRSDTKTPEKLNHTFTLGQVIVATNLAGRGTDINITKQVCDSGGLFVLVTFLPVNKRVEEQAFGRAGRKGQPGTSQIILNSNHLPSDLRHLRNLKQIQKQREKRYKAFMKFMEGGEVQECLLRQSLFKLYCEAISHVHEMTFCNKSEKNIMLNSLHEFWGMWLQMQAKQITELRKDDLEMDLNMRLNTALNTATLRLSPTNNIYHVINYANNRLPMQQYGEALKLYSRAVETNEKFSSIAHYNKAYCTIKMAGKKYLHSAVTELELAHSNLCEYIDEAVLIKQLVELSLGVNQPPVNSPTETDVSSTEQCSQDFDVFEESDVKNSKMSSLSRCVESRIQLFNCIRRNIQESLEKLNHLKTGRHEAETEVTSIFKLVCEGDNDMQRELYEIWKHGLTFTFCVKKKPRFCWEGFVVTILGVAQVITGVIFLAVTMGPLCNIGIGLIAEGVSDIIEGCIGMFSGELSMCTWAKSKAVSVAISMVSFSVAKLASKGVRPCMTSATKAWNELKTIPSLLSKGLKTAGEKTITQTMKESTKHAAKYATKVFIEKAAPKGFNYLQQTFTEKLTQHIAEVLHSKIKTSMHDTFESTSLKKQIDRLVINTLYENEENTSDQKQLLEIIKKLSNEVVDPVVSAQGLKPILSKLKPLLEFVKKRINDKDNAVISFLEKLQPYLPIICDTIYGAWKIAMLCREFNQKLGDKIGKFCDEHAIEDCAERDTKKERNTQLYKRIQNEVSRILSWAIANVFVQHIASNCIRKVRSSASDAIRDATNRSPTSSETLKKICSMKTKPSTACMPDNDVANGTSNTLKNKYVDEILTDISIGSFTHFKILCELLGKNIEVYETTKEGLRKSAVISGVSINDSSIKVVYHKPHPGCPDGSYDVFNKDNVLGLREERKSLFKAVAESLNPHESSTFIEARAKQYKKDIIDELFNNFNRWQELIDFTEWGKRL